MARVIVEVVSGKTASLKECLDELRETSILEAQSAGPIHNVLKPLPGYIGFEYFDGIRPGQYYNGILCNDLENLTFQNGCFDIVVTQDVFEHLPNPEKAFSEIHRVLKIGGHHVFAVPLHEGRQSKSRAGLPPVYHGDYLRREGSLVYTDWGDDILLTADSVGMRTRRADLHRFYRPDEITDVDRSYGELLTTSPINYYKYNSVVFISRRLT